VRVSKDIRPRSLVRPSTSKFHPQPKTPLTCELIEHQLPTRIIRRVYGGSSTRAPVVGRFGEWPPDC